MTAPQIMLSVLDSRPDDYLAVHEITAIARSQGHYISDNAAASRLCIDLKGAVESRYRKGKRFKEWRVNSDRRRFLAHESNRRDEERRVEAAENAQGGVMGVFGSECIRVVKKTTENAREAAQESAGLDSLGRGPK